MIRALVKNAAAWALAAGALVLAAWLLFAACESFPAFGRVMIKVADCIAAALCLLVILILGLSLLRFDEVEEGSASVGRPAHDGDSGHAGADVRRPADPVDAGW